MPSTSRPLARRGAAAAPRVELEQRRRGRSQLRGGRVAGTLWVRASKKISSRSPRSTISPSYMTSTRSATSATTPRSWVIRIVARPRSRFSRSQQFEDLRLDRHVERRRRLVGDQHFRLQRQRHRDHRPLPHPAGELVRVVGRRAARASGMPTESSSSTARSPRLAPGSTCGRWARIASTIWAPTR